MKIIEFSDSFIPIMDGVGNVVYQYAMNLPAKGHECYVVAPMTDTGFRGGYPFELVDYMGMQLSSMKSYTVGVPNLDAHCQARLKMINADIVHVHSPFVAGQAGLQYANNHDLPIVGTFHSKYYDDFLQDEADANEETVNIFLGKITDWYGRYRFTPHNIPVTRPYSIKSYFSQNAGSTALRSFYPVERFYSFLPKLIAKYGRNHERLLAPNDCGYTFSDNLDPYNINMFSLLSQLGFYSFSSITLSKVSSCYENY